MSVATLPLAAGSATGLDAVIQRYAHYGPLLAAFLANLLATFGDKGQLVVITLATRYDAKKVFFGSMAAFTGWSALEVVLGQYITAALPADVMAGITGTLFLVFGAWTTLQVLRRARAQDLLASDGGLETPSARTLPDSIARFTHGHGPIVTSFVFVAFAEFGDKTQLLTINLAATFPASPVSVFVGVVAALALRTGIDAFIGERAERLLPTLFIEAASAVVFVAFGLYVFGLIGNFALIAVVVAAVFFCIGAAAHRQIS